MICCFSWLNFYFRGVQLGQTRLIDFEAGEHECFDKSLCLFALFSYFIRSFILYSCYACFFFAFSFYYNFILYSQWGPLSSNFTSVFSLPLFNLYLSFLSSYFLFKCCWKDNWDALISYASRTCSSLRSFALKLYVVFNDMFWNPYIFTGFFSTWMSKNYW